MKMYKAIALFCCLAATVSCAKSNRGEASNATASTQNDGNEEALTTVSADKKKITEEEFIRDFYAKYLTLEEIWFGNKVPKDSAEAVKNKFLNDYCTKNFQRYYKEYYATNELGEMINGEDCDLITNSQDDEGLQPKDMVIEKKEPNWYTASFVWRHKGLVRGGMCRRLKLVANSETFKVDSLMSSVFLESEKDSIYKATDVDTAPRFVGGEKALRQYVENAGLTCKWTISGDKKNSVQVSFVVDENGWTRMSWIENESILGEGEHSYGKIDDIYRLMVNMPRWQSGTKGGKKVRTKMYVYLKMA